METAVKMVAFHGDPKIKAKYLKRADYHRKHDQIVKGQYWEDGKGCAIGCLFHTSDHMAIEREWDIPVQLAYLADGIFENLPNEIAMDWPKRFASAPRVGADLSYVVNHFLIWLLTDGVHGVIRFAVTEAQKKAIQDVSNLHALVISGNPPSAAAQAAARAARAAARAAAGTAARAAARAARAAAGTAAWSAAWAAARAAAWDAAYVSYADKLIELMENS